MARKLRLARDSGSRCKSPVSGERFESVWRRLGDPDFFTKSAGTCHPSIDREARIDASSEGERVLWGKRTRSRSREIPSSKRGEVSCESHEGSGQQDGFRAHSSIGLEVPRISAVIRDSGGRTRRGLLPPSAQVQGTRVRARNSRRGPGKPGRWPGRSNSSRRPRLRRGDHRESSR